LKPTQPETVRAPYPTKIIQPRISVPSYEKHLLVHGFVAANGQFRDLRVVPPVKPDTAQTLVAALSGWVFRPASREGSAVEVEFVLAIPVAGLPEPGK
jgi:hypothetical protein